MSRIFGRKEGFNILLRTLSKLKENKSLVVYTVVIFFLINVFSLTELYRDMKYSRIILIPSYYSRLA